MKRVVLVALLTSYAYCFSQSSIIPAFLWYNAGDYSSGSLQWQDLSGHGQHASVQGENAPGSALFNYNRSFLFDGGTSPFVLPLPVTRADFTVMIAYRTDDTLSERGLWSIAADSSYVGISTRRIFGRQMTIDYSDTNRTDAIVNTITQNWESVDSAAAAFRIGVVDSFPFKGKLGEVVVFDRRIGGLELLKWQSYIAIKYGITLTGRDYVTSSGDTIWHYGRHPEYAAAVSGIGRDTLFGLYQKQSLMNDRLSVGVSGISTNNDSNTGILNPGDFLVWGSDSSLFSTANNTYLPGGLELQAYGTCLMEVTGNTIRTFPTSLQVDVSRWQDADPLYCVLLIERNPAGDFSGNSVELYTPSHFDTAGIVTFSDIYWDPDYSGSDLFRIGFYPNDTTQISMRSLVATNSGNTSYSDQETHASHNFNSYQLYPNPTSGDYNLNISLACESDVLIRILDPQGKILETKSGKGQKTYRFTGSLQTKGHYLIEIESALERKTLQLIIH